MDMRIEDLNIAIDFRFMKDLRPLNSRGKRNKFFGSPIITVCRLTDSSSGSQVARTTEAMAWCSESEKICSKVRGKKVALAKALIKAFPESKDIRRRVWECYLGPNLIFSTPPNQDVGAAGKPEDQYTGIPGAQYVR